MPLGAGGMGVVHLARSASGLRLAVKVVHAEFAQDPEFRGRFRQEVAAARRVSGAFTAPVVDADPDSERPWMATLYIPGPTLSAHVKRKGPLPLDEVRKLGAGLAEALRDIHRAGVVHRDLKPSNVLLAADGPKVIDFGISRPSDSEMRTETGKLIGTPPFMAPEQFQRPREVGPAADVFALGSVLVHAATGSGPFDSESPYLVAYQVVHDEADLAGVPEELAPLLRSCLAKDPADRPTPSQLMARLRVDLPTELYLEPLYEPMAAARAAPATEAGPGAGPATDPSFGPDSLLEPDSTLDAPESRVSPAPSSAASPALPAPYIPLQRGPAEAVPTHVRVHVPAGPSAPAGPAKAPAPRRARRWAVWAAVAAVLVAGGGFLGVRALLPEDGPVRHSGGTEAAEPFHPWRTALLERSADHPAEMPFCSFAPRTAPSAAAPAPALFCAQRGVRAARVDPEHGAVQWRLPAGPATGADLPPAAPVFSGGLLYALSADGRRLDAFDPAADGKGARRWSRDVSAYHGQVAVVGDAVLLTAADGTVTALDSRTHEQRWRRAFPGHALPRFQAYGTGGGTAYAATVQDGGRTLVTAIGLAHGTVRWERRLPGTLTPVGLGSGGALFLTSAAQDSRTKAVVRYAPGSGAVRTYRLAAPLDDALAAVRGDTVYLLAYGGTLQAVGARTWQVETSVSRGSQPVVAGDRLYFSAADGRLLAVDTRHGAMLGQTKPRLATGRGGFLETLPTPAVDPAGRRVFAAAPDGTVFGVDAEDPGRW
ncbi:PQQ-binding-like beta-propeller repeat protein [Streptomyces sp. NPDC000151]|uniref:serine/threonine-protein kinase n=1 Tax=Streptomyces sp. NPDC000151 TaxID=3154244 RepID=UPI003324B754